MPRAQVAHAADEALSVVGQGGKIGDAGAVVAETGEGSGRAIIGLAGRVAAAASTVVRIIIGWSTSL